MLLYLFLLFAVLPIIELALLVWIGVKTVWWLPVVLVLFTGVAGAMLARRQGWQIGSKIQNDLRSGRVPAGALLDGFLILVAAILLITPGVFTDVLGLALLLPPVRASVKRVLLSHVRHQVQVKSAKLKAAVNTRGNGGHANPDNHDTVIDAKVISTRVEDA